MKRFVMPGPLAVLIDQADRLAPRCAHRYGASGAQSRYRIMPTTTPRIYSDVLIAVALWPIAYLSNRLHGHRALANSACSRSRRLWRGYLPGRLADRPVRPNVHIPRPAGRTAEPAPHFGKRRLSRIV